MPEVKEFMDARGFIPYDFCGQLHGASDRAMLQTDVIFVTNSGLRMHRRYSMFEPENAKALI